MNADLSKKKSTIYEIKSTHTTKIIIFVPYCDVYKPYIIDCLTSIENQKYSNYHIILVNDGSKDMNFLIHFINWKPFYTILSTTECLGPAHSKWTFINYLQQNRHHFNMNDIVLIVDGDDTLLRSDAFYIINQTYAITKCWCTFGEAVGKFCDNSLKNVSNINFDNVRKSTWAFNHPRSMKLHILLNLKEQEFKCDSEWLQKGTDRPIVYGMLEMSGENRSQHIPISLYNYREHELNSYKTVENAILNKHKLHVVNANSHECIVEDIHIVMCCWKRLFNLEQQIKMLNEQTCAQQICFHLINNNPNTASELNEMVERFRNLYTNIRIFLRHYDNKYFGFQRFFYIRDVIYKMYIAEYVIIIDDDQIFDCNWVQTMYASAKPKTYSGWYMKKWCFDMNYWTGSIINMSHCKSKQQGQITTADYIATCGCIIDIRAFSDDSKLWNIPSDLPEGISVYNIEDLWLSFILSKYYNWNLQRSFHLPITDLNSMNPKSEQVSLFLSLRTEKQKLFEYLVYKRGWLEPLLEF